MREQQLIIQPKSEKAKQICLALSLFYLDKFSLCSLYLKSAGD